MQSSSVQLRMVFLKRLQLLGAGSAVLLSTIIILRFLKIDISAGNEPTISGYGVLILMLVFPAVVLFLGSVVQFVFQKKWALIPVLSGGAFNLIFVGGNAGFLFVYIGDKLGQFVVVADLLFVVMTMGVAIINLTLPAVLKPKTTEITPSTQ